MHRGLIIDFNSIAAMLAHEGDDVQSAFFNTFDKELRAACGTYHASEMQMTYVAGKLTENCKETLSTLTFKP